MGIIAWIVFGLIAALSPNCLCRGAMAGIYPDLYSRYCRGGRWRMAGDDVWYWRQYQRL